MHVIERFALLAPFLALVACGGSTSRIVGESDAGGDGEPPPGCPTESYVGDNGTCSDVGAQCPGTVTVPGCNGSSTETVECTCASGAWQCPVVISGGCPVPNPGCPDPSQVTQSSSCDVTPGTSCTSNIPIPSCGGASPGNIACVCENGQWQCPEYGIPLCDAGGGCPPSDEVFAGSGCDDYGATCDGDPQACAGTTVYDTLQCTAGLWQILASTYCDEYDGGFADAQVADAGVGF